MPTWPDCGCPRLMPRYRRWTGPVLRPPPHKVGPPGRISGPASHKDKQGYWCTHSAHNPKEILCMVVGGHLIIWKQICPNIDFKRNFHTSSAYTHRRSLGSHLRMIFSTSYTWPGLKLCFLSLLAFQPWIPSTA